MWLIILLSLAATLLFWKISTRGINEWDEARNGVNAYEMYHRGDFINLYYGGKPDTWNAKPPLLIWLICVCYKIFGFNAFALRFPSALAALGSLFFAFKLFRKAVRKDAALYACAMLISCKALIGGHIGLTGDFDALLLLCLIASAYYFWCYCYEGKKRAIFKVALWTGFAWYVKGPAAFILLPGFMLVASLKKPGWISDRKVWLSTGLLLLTVISWFVAIRIYGTKTGGNDMAGTNAIHTMFVEDVWRRFTAAGFEGGQENDYFFFFSALDVRFNLWNYLFFLLFGGALFQLWRKKQSLRRALLQKENEMLLFNVCLGVVYSLAKL